MRRGARRVRRAAEDAVGGVSDKVAETFESARQRVEQKIDEARKNDKDLGRVLNKLTETLNG